MKNKHWFLVQYSGDDNPIELIDKSRLDEINYNAEEFDGFSGIRVILGINETIMQSLKQQFANVEI